MKMLCKRNKCKFHKWNCRTLYVSFVDSQVGCAKHEMFYPEVNKVYSKFPISYSCFLFQFLDMIDHSGKVLISRKDCHVWIFNKYNIYKSLFLINHSLRVYIFMICVQFGTEFKMLIKSILNLMNPKTLRKKHFWSIKAAYCSNKYCRVTRKVSRWAFMELVEVAFYYDPAIHVSLCMKSYNEEERGETDSC